MLRNVNVKMQTKMLGTARNAKYQHVLLVEMDLFAVIMECVPQLLKFACASLDGLGTTVEQ